MHNNLRFKTYYDIVVGQEIQMGNESRSKMIGKGNMDIIFTLGKKKTLTTVLQAPDIK